jgi:predicted metal-dependent hydrolase
MLKDVEFTVKRSNRKTISIYVERDGTVSVLAPKTMEEAALEEAIQSKAYMIYKHLAEWEQANASRINRTFVNGQSYMYLGRNYRLEFVEEQDVPLKLKHGYFLLKKSEAENAEKHFIQFYKTKGLPKLIDYINEFKAKMNVEPKDIKIMELQNRWGSCTEKGNLNFHWKCIMAPVRTIQYIVVHELAHLIQMNHSPAFWQEIDRIFPDYHKDVKWLREYGASMDL